MANNGSLNYWEMTLFSFLWVGNSPPRPPHPPCKLILTWYRPQTIRRSSMKIIIISRSPKPPMGGLSASHKSTSGGHDVWQSAAEQKCPSQDFLITGFWNRTLMMHKGESLHCRLRRALLGGGRDGGANWTSSVAEQHKTYICKRACNTIFTVRQPRRTLCNFIRGVDSWGGAFGRAMAERVSGADETARGGGCSRAAVPRFKQGVADLFGSESYFMGTESCGGQPVCYTRLK